MKRIYIALFIMSLMFQINSLKAQLIEHVYDFNSLPITDTLNGKDNWKSVPNAVSGGDFNIAYSVGSSITPDATLGAWYAHGGPSVGQTASRKTQTNFPFDFSIGGVMEVEAQIMCAYWGTSFGFGYDANNNGIIANVSQGIEANEGGIWLNIQTKTPANSTVVLPNGTVLTFTYDSIPGWNTYKFLIDFDANNSQGSLTLYAKRPTDSNFSVIPEVNNLNLGLTPGSNNKLDPATWKTLFIQSLGGISGFDNLIIRQPNTGGLQYQYIIFNSLPTQILTSNPPITLQAHTNKNLPVNFTVAGPATVSNDSILTLTGDTGTVTVTAHQPGDSLVAAAADLPMSFYVVNPAFVFPNLDIKNPVDSNIVRAPHLDAIPLSFATSINYSNLFGISQVYFTINSQNIYPDSTNNGYYVYYWTPPAFGTYTISASAVSTGGPITTKSVTFEVVPDSSSINYYVIDTLHFANVPGQNLDTTLIFPSFTGTYNKITAYLQYDCPAEGCDAWDVIGYVNIRGANGNWVELVRYITPYGIACHDSIDVTDYVSQLQGKVDIQANFPSMSKITFILKYYQGTPTYKYSWMDKLWLGDYNFGGWGAGTTTGFPTSQPVEIKNLNLWDPNITSASLRLVSTGHGSGTDNTDNAAEFYDATHQFKINGTTIYSQNLWRVCNPSPAGCTAQSGTWQYNRSGWCPGSIPMLWEIDLSASIGSDVSLQYEFDPTYLNLCTAANPNCVDGVTCSSCAGGTKPNIMVAGELVKFYGGIPNLSSVENITDDFKLNIYPNPSNGFFNLSANKKFTTDANIDIYNLSGILLKEMKWNGEPIVLNLSDFSKGIYVLKVSNQKGIEYKKLIVQ